jgi:hypothetical protein
MAMYSASVPCAVLAHDVGVQAQRLVAGQAVAAVAAVGVAVEHGLLADPQAAAGRRLGHHAGGLDALHQRQSMCDADADCHACTSRPGSARRRARAAALRRRRARAWAKSRSVRPSRPRRFEDGSFVMPMVDELIAIRAHAYDLRGNPQFDPEAGAPIYAWKSYGSERNRNGMGTGGTTRRVAGHRFEGRVCVVTGAARGIGLRHRRAPGSAKAAAWPPWDVSERRLAARRWTRCGPSGLDVHGFVCDVGARAAVAQRRWRPSNQQLRCRPVAVLVNNAVWARFGPLAEILDEETVDRTLAVGLKALLWTTQAVLPQMRRLRRPVQCRQPVVDRGLSRPVDRRRRVCGDEGRGAGAHEGRRRWSWPPQRIRVNSGDSRHGRHPGIEGAVRRRRTLAAREAAMPLRSLRRRPRTSPRPWPSWPAMTRAYVQGAELDGGRRLDRSFARCDRTMNTIARQTARATLAVDHRWPAAASAAPAL